MTSPNGRPGTLARAGRDPVALLPQQTLVRLGLGDGPGCGTVWLDRQGVGGKDCKAKVSTHGQGRYRVHLIDTPRPPIPTATYTTKETA